MKRVNLINSHDYWAQREAEQLKHNITDEAEYEEEIKRIYQEMLDACQKEIESFYGRYASAEGITIAEAKKRVSKMDIEAYERKAAKYVAEKNFSEQANEEMRLYNAAMKINRLEMLKANIGLELIAGHDELDKFMGDILQGRTEAELNRQAGILGKTIRNNAQKANAIVNGSFHNATFSDRIWQYQDLMRQDIGKLLQTGLIQGKNPRALTKDLKKYWYGNDPLTGKGQVYCMERLMRTELARVQTEAQKQSFIRNGFEEYEFITNGGCCDICKALDGKHFKVAKMMPGENAPPMHPNCVLPGTKIIAPDMEAMTKSEYSGYIVEIGTANGTRLSVTANHIVLTARGWVRAKNIVKGDKVIYYSGWAESVIESNPANCDCIPAVEELFASLVKSSPMPPLRVPVSAEDFKGDVIPNSKVDVVFINGELRDKIDSTARKLVSDVLLIGADKGCKGILPGNCSLAKFLMGAGLVADGIMSGLDVAGVLFGGSVSHHELVCLRRPSDYDSRLFKTAIDNGTADTKFFSDGVLTDSRCVHFNDTVNVEVDSNSIKLNTAPSETPFNRAFVDAVNIGDLLSAFSGFVSFDDVVFVSNKFYSGHVYDASSLSTLYIANGILSSNCRCSTAAYIDSKEYEEWLDYLDKGGTTVSWNERKNNGNINAAMNKYGESIQFNLDGLSEDGRKSVIETIKSLSDRYNTCLREVQYNRSLGAVNGKENGHVDITGSLMEIKNSKVATHEFFHTLDSTKRSKYGFETDDDFWKEAKGLFRKYKKDANAPGSSVRISSYSTTDADEFFAEAFAVANGASPADTFGVGASSPYVESAIKIIDKYFKKQ